MQTSQESGPREPSKSSNTDVKIEEQVPGSDTAHELQPLREGRFERTLVIVWTLILCTLPALFLIQSIICWRYDGFVASQHPRLETLLRINKLVGRLTCILKTMSLTNKMPTAFPIVFTAIGSTAMKRIALYKMQKGAHLGLIEQLQGSTSFFGTVQVAYYLRNIKISVPLLVFWALSPIGGQAALRQLEKRTIFISKATDIMYPNYQVPWDPTNNGTWFSRAGIFTEALRTPFSSPKSELDIWGRVKIRKYSNNTHDNMVEGQMNYWSWRGIPIFGIDPKYNASMTIDANFLESKCRKSDEAHKPLHSNSSMTAHLVDTQGEMQVVDIGLNGSYWGSCNVTLRFVKARINCNSTCVAEPSTLDESKHGSPEQTLNITSAFYSRFTAAANLEDADSVIRNVFAEINSPSKTYIDVMSHGVEMFLNTFRMSEYVFPTEQISSLRDIRVMTQDPKSLNNGTQIIYQPQAIYASNMIWSMISIASSLCLVVVAVTGAVIEVHTVSPDILGFVSVLAARYPSVHLQEHSSTLSGPKLAYLARHKRVALAEVGREVSMVEATGSWTPLDKRKFYR